MTPPEPATTLEVLPNLTGKEALLLARLLSRLADEIWRTYSGDISLVLIEEEGLKQLLMPDPSLLPLDDDDDDLPF